MDMMEQNDDQDDLFESAGLEEKKQTCARADSSQQSSFIEINQSDTSSMLTIQSSSSKKMGFGSKLLSVFKKKEIKPYTEKELSDFIKTGKCKNKLKYKKLKETMHQEGCFSEQFRPQVWKLLCNVRQYREKNYGLYNYPQLVHRQLPQDVNELIMKDLERTVIENAEFEIRHCTTGKNKLFNILKAYANLDPIVGYMQGMNFIAAMLILNLHDEEDCFWAFVYVMLPSKGIQIFEGGHNLIIQGKHNWRGVFMPGMPKALELDKKIKKLLHQKCPKVLQAVLEETDGTSIYPAFGSLYLSIFLVDCPFETSRRLFEVFLLQGEKFMLQILFKFSKYKEAKILSMQSHRIMRFIRHEMTNECLCEKGSVKEMLK